MAVCLGTYLLFTDLSMSSSTEFGRIIQPVAFMRGGETPRRDPARAAVTFERVCTGAHAGACADLGLMRYRGDGVTRDQQKGLRGLRRNASYRVFCFPAVRPASEGDSPPYTFCLRNRGNRSRLGGPGGDAERIGGESR